MPDLAAPVPTAAVVEPVEDDPAAVAVLDAGRAHHHHQQQAEGVGDDEPLTAVILSYLILQFADLR